jgi:hypothetical protein
MSQQRRMLERQEREYDRKEQTRAAVSSRVGAGDYDGAMSQAIAGGEFDLAGSLGKLDESQRKQALQEAQILGQTAARLKSIPLEARGPALQRLAPMLRSAGFGEDELAAADLSDEGLDSYVQMGEAVSASLVKPRNPAEDPTFIRELEAMGIDPRSPQAREIFENRYRPPNPQIVTVDGVPNLVNGDGGARDLPRVSTPEERDRLPPGAEYIAPDGTVKRKGGAAPTTAPANFPPGR